MVNFLAYMSFSTFEFIAMLFLGLAVFRFDWRYYKKEVVFTSILITLVSYVFITTDSTEIWQIVQLALLYAAYKYVFRQSWLYSIWLTLGTIVAYLSVQTVILLLCTHYGLVIKSDLSNSFGFMTYFIQSLSAFISIVIGSYVRYANQGFGLTFRTKINRKLYLVVALVSLIFFSLGHYLFSSNASYFYLSIASILALFVVFIILSHKKDQEEFNLL